MQAFDRGLQRIRLDIGQHHLHAGLRKRPSASPIPSAPPVTKAVLPARSRMAVSPGIELPYLHDPAAAASELR